MKSLLLAVAVLVSGLLLVGPGGGAAHAATCAAPAYPSVNGGFTSEVKTTRVSCATAYELLAKEYRCRTGNGPSGRCVQKVMGFGCREQRYSDFYAATFAATVTCSRHHKKVTWSYEQSKTAA